MRAHFTVLTPVLVVSSALGLSFGSSSAGSPNELIRAAVTRSRPGENYPVLPSVPTAVRMRIVDEIIDSPDVRAAYEKLDDRKGRHADRSRAVGALKKHGAVWSLLSCLCHPHESVQLDALRSLRQLRDRRCVPFLLIYAQYMAVHEEGSEEATIHGIIHEETAKVLSAVTGVEVVLKGQDPTGLRKGIKKWRRWLVDHDDVEEDY